MVIDTAKKLDRTHLVSLAPLVTLFLGVIINSVAYFVFDKELLNLLTVFMATLASILYLIFTTVLLDWLHNNRKRHILTEGIILAFVGVVVFISLWASNILEYSISVAVYAVIMYTGCDTINEGKNNKAITLKKIGANFFAFCWLLALVSFSIYLVEIHKTNDPQNQHWIKLTGFLLERGSLPIDSFQEEFINILSQYITFVIGVTYIHYQKGMIYLVGKIANSLSSPLRTFMDNFSHNAEEDDDNEKD